MISPDRMEQGQPPEDQTRRQEINDYITGVFLDKNVIRTGSPKPDGTPYTGLDVIDYFIDRFSEDPEKPSRIETTMRIAEHFDISPANSVRIGYLLRELEEIEAHAIPGDTVPQP